VKTLEQAFIVMADHLRRQGERSVGVVHGEGTCMYRDPSGRKCAVGALISDDEYRDSLETMLVTDLPVKAALDASGWPTDDRAIGLYRAMQSVHDNYKPSQWRTHALFIAKEYGFVNKSVT